MQYDACHLRTFRKKKKTHLRAVKFLSINQESTFLRNKSCYMHTTWNSFLRNFLHPGCFTHGMETYCNFTTTSLKMSSTRFSVKLVVAGCPSFRSRSDSVIKKDFKLKISFHVSVSFNLINWTMLFEKTSHTHRPWQWNINSDTHKESIHHESISGFFW